jgi:uncharacterized protein YdeI (YjbR/CyaY-like superfamily)
MLTLRSGAAKPGASPESGTHSITHSSGESHYAVGVAAKQKFRGVLEAGSTGSLNWVIVWVPFDPAEVWPRRNRLRVLGTINGFAFRTSLFKSAEKGYLLLVNKTMQRGAGVRPGHIAEVVLEPDLEERTVVTPPELEKLLRQSRSLRTWHDRLSDSYRRAIADWITQAKSAASRTKRAERTAERMMLAMEGERHLPPILEAAFLSQPKARAGWQAMTPVQRRGHLLGIFYYQSPESRRKRTQRAVDEALHIAARDSSAVER